MAILTPVNGARRIVGYRGGMDDFRIDPPLIVKDSPKPLRLASLADARAFVRDEMRLGRPPAWRDIHHRLAAAGSEDEATEAIGALRELLDLEDLLVHPNLPLETESGS